jgi:K+-sensing histidine kinase KdpD
LAGVPEPAQKRPEHSGDEPVTITVSGTELDDGCQFVVEDDCPGIDEYIQDDIFQMFESSESYQPEAQARGIGLAVVEGASAGTTGRSESSPSGEKVQGQSSL